MKKSKFLSVLAITLLTGVALSGCKKENTSDSSSEPSSEIVSSNVGEHNSSSSSSSSSAGESSSGPSTNSSTTSSGGNGNNSTDSSNGHTTLTPLAAPEGVVANTISGGYNIAFSNVSNANGYEAKFVNGKTYEELQTFKTVTNGGALDLTSIPEGFAYKVYVRAKGDGTTTSDSPWSTTFGVVNVGTIVMQAPESEEEIAYIEGEDTGLRYNAYSFYNDEGASVSSHTVKKDTATFTFTPVGEGNAWAFQIFYKNTNLVKGKTYNLTYKLNTTKAGNITIKDATGEQKRTLIQGDNEINIQVKEDDKASLKIIVPATFATNEEVTFKVIDPQWKEPSTAELQDGGSITPLEDTKIEGAGVMLYFNTENIEMTQENSSKYSVGALTCDDEAVEFADTKEISDFNWDGKKARVYFTLKAGFAADDNNVRTFTAQILGEKKFYTIKAMFRGTKYVVKEEIESGDETSSISSKNKFKYSSDTNVTMSEHYTLGNAAYFTFSKSQTVSGNTLDVFYKNEGNQNGQQYTLTFKLFVSVAATVEDEKVLVNGKAIALSANEWNNVSVEYTESDSEASLHLEVKGDLLTDDAISLQIDNLKWKEYSEVKAAYELSVYKAEGAWFGIQLNWQDDNDAFNDTTINTNNLSVKLECNNHEIALQSIMDGPTVNVEDKYIKTGLSFANAEFANNKATLTLEFLAKSGKFKHIVATIDFANGNTVDNLEISELEISSHTVSFDLNYDSAPQFDETRIVYENKTYGDLPTPSQAPEGKTFDGWYTEKEAGEKITPTSIVQKTSDHTLYAHWAEKQDYVVEAIYCSGADVGIKLKWEDAGLKPVNFNTDNFTFEVTITALNNKKLGLNPTTNPPTYEEVINDNEAQVKIHLESAEFINNASTFKMTIKTTSNKTYEISGDLIATNSTLEYSNVKVTALS